MSWLAALGLFNQKECIKVDDTFRFCLVSLDLLAATWLFIGVARGFDTLRLALKVGYLVFRLENRGNGFYGIFCSFSLLLQRKRTKRKEPLA